MQQFDCYLIWFMPLDRSGSSCRASSPGRAARCGLARRDNLGECPSKALEDGGPGHEPALPAVLHVSHATIDKDRTSSDEDKETDDTFSSWGCFEATTAYGDSLHPDVVALRRFRELRLRKSVTGRGLIQLYWVIGPVFARFVDPRKSLGRNARRILSPISIQLDPWGPRQVRIAPQTEWFSHRD